MKSYDADPAENPHSSSIPKERITPSPLSSDLRFEIPANCRHTVQIEITTLTGCTAPIRNTMYIN